MPNLQKNTSRNRMPLPWPYLPKKRINNTTKYLLSFTITPWERTSSTAAATTTPKMIPSTRAEDRALALTCEHANLENGLDILGTGLWLGLALTLDG
jgi:hypothetical protein